MLCGRNSLFTPRFLATVGSSCSWLEWASSSYLSFLLFSDCRTSSWFSPYIFSNFCLSGICLLVIQLTNVFDVSDGMTQMNHHHSVRNYFTTMFQSLHFLFLCLSLLGYATRIVSTDLGCEVHKHTVTDRKVFKVWNSRNCYTEIY